MKNIHLSSISQLHDILGINPPKHPLISLIDAKHFGITAEKIGYTVSNDFYMIALKDKSCGMDYGRHSFDFEEGVLIFSAPNQVSTITKEVPKGSIEGWTLYVHPELIRSTNLSVHMDEFQFFNYEVYEALHLSKEEQKTITDCVKNIESEYNQRIDNHSQRVMVSILELLLNYAQRYYERQFNTRASINKDVVSLFESELKDYINHQLPVLNELPSIQYFAEKAHLSQHYFSDVIKKETGRTPKDHINDLVIAKAKNKLLHSEQSISEIAYDLGFNYPHYFTRLFKSKTGKTPLEYRSMN